MKIRKNTIETTEITTPPTEDITADNNAFLDRDTYRKIKKMDRESMQSFLADIYESGRQKEREEAGVTTDDAAEDTQELDISRYFTGACYDGCDILPYGYPDYYGTEHRNLCDRTAFLDRSK